MNEAIREAFVPKNLEFYFWKDIVCVATRSMDTFVAHTELDQDLECKDIVIKSTNGEVIDTIERDINLRKGDILHFEYKINVKFW